MPRLIDKDALKARALSAARFFCDDEDTAMMLEAIESAPTVDAVPVRRGEWIPGVNNSQKCSKCFTNKHYGVKGNFCPNCGADMRERSDVE